MAPSSAAPEARESESTRRSQQEPRSKKRKSGEAFGKSSASSAPAAKKFQHLKPRTRHISTSVINDKWTALPQGAQHNVRELFKAAKRPVILSRRDEAHRREAEMVLDHIVQRLEKRLPQMPFPPKSKEDHFNLDKLVERNVGVFANLKTSLLD